MFIDFLGFNSAGAAEGIHETSEGNDDHAAIYVGGFVSVLYLFESKKVRENQKYLAEKTNEVFF